MTDSEAKVKKYLEREGFTVISRGWPDFLCVRNPTDRLRAGVAAVEVKAGRDNLSPEQRQVHAVLKTAGIPVYTLRPEALASRSKRPQPLLVHTEYAFEQLNRKVASLQSEVERLQQMISGAQVLLDESDDDIETVFAPPANDADTAEEPRTGMEQYRVDPSAEPRVFEAQSEAPHEST